VEPKAVGITGYMGGATMALRLATADPKTYCTAIARTPIFDEFFMPELNRAALSVPVHMIRGEKEPEWAVEDGEAAKEYFKSYRFRNVVHEMIPNSGLDSRPEITSNYFRAAVQKTLGTEQMAFYKVYSTGARCLLGLAAPRDVAGSEGTPTGTALPKVRESTEPVSPTAALAGLEAFGRKYPESEFLPAVEFMRARIANEKQKDAAEAEAILKPFMRSPLRNSPVAAEALFYLAEKVIDHQTHPRDATRALTVITTLRHATAEQKTRARERRKELAKKKD
jgi:hypothetical protein